MTDTYQEFLNSKRLTVPSVGKPVEAGDIHSALFPFQRDIVKWAVRKGRAAIFADVGLGKTIMQLEWARQLKVPTLIVAPLAVTEQTVKQGKSHLGLDIKPIRTSDAMDADHTLYIINYEMLDHVDASKFQAVILDESSILKSFNGITRNMLIEKFSKTSYRLCCTATPAPNDVMELGSHAEFLGVMSQSQMAAVFFVHEAGVFDGGSGAAKERWRLKRHARESFYQWLASWSMALKKPSDLGYSDEGYNLPAMNVKDIIAEYEFTPEGMLPGIGIGAISAAQLGKIRHGSIEQRASLVADLVNSSSEQWLVWTGLNDEADYLAKILSDSVNVYGAQSPDEKVKHLMAFAEGRQRVLITKSSIAGFGMNLQNCANMIFFGMDYSWESYYQAIGRIYRFGQQHDTVNIYRVISSQDTSILEAIEAKGKGAKLMTQQLIDASKNYEREELQQTLKVEMNYKTDKVQHGNWTMLLGDSTELLKDFPDNSGDIAVYSPPFSDMYIYNNSPRDLSNSANMDEFFTHYSFIIREMLRISKPGRLNCVHVQDVKAFINKDGFRGAKDFSGQIIEAYVNAGWEFRTRITIDKNPQIVATRNKDTDLLFVTGKRDSTKLAPMLTDYLLVFRKPGDNAVPVKPYENGEMSEQDWINWAHAVWYDIRETDVLNVSVARSNDDEKHMCPLQLPLIERCLKLWSNPGETVLSPFAGIGSEGVVSVQNNRKFIGIELKPEYYQVAQRNLKSAEVTTMDLFGWAEMQKSS